MAVNIITNYTLLSSFYYKNVIYIFLIEQDVW